ncbi:MAG: hypothetical protein KC619_33345, partial [Myxococcales bacterium]|nr:hypothetical protein [Myxococcales bacterium]
DPLPDPHPDPDPDSDPPPAPAPGACGEWSWLIEWTCEARAAEFVRCGPQGLEFLVCPEGYYCAPGTTTVECLWGDYARR